MSIMWRISAALLLGAASINAMEFHRLDGVHRIEKKAQITAIAELGRRSDDVCDTSMKICPSSLGGGCCPDNYDCAQKSCYATTKGPSTCGTKVGWHVCEAVYGSGCCPDGYMCQTAGNCVPPSGDPYTQNCPASHFLCPASMSYGCCPDGMGCGVNQCYSTEPVTKTSTMAVTTTKNGDRTVYTTTAVTVETPSAPTAFPTGGSDGGDDAGMLKYFPSAMPQVTPSSDSDSDSGKHGGGGLSGAQLGGIIGGAAAFLIIILVGAYIIIRHLNKVVAAVNSSQKSKSTKRPPMKQFKPTDSEVDALSVDPLMMPSPRPSYPRRGSGSDGVFGPGSPGCSSPGQSSSSFAGAYHSVAGGSSKHANPTGYFDAILGRSGRYSPPSSHAGSASHVSHDSLTHHRYRDARFGSAASEVSVDSDTDTARLNLPPSELEARAYVSELPGSPSAPSRKYRRRSKGTLERIMTRPPMTHQRKWSDGWGAGRVETAKPRHLGIANEEMHGFHGPAGQMVGQTAHRPVTTSPVSPTKSDADKNARR